ncbi:MAG: sugar ABC transporter ATP-binding protein [Treponema sp.]|jgi:ribose transport system ATP-binding protein|nr:sugar ABC transporter ATP-binding protein [Treponema sp.]
MIGGETVLEVKGISKYFPGVQALKDIDLDIKRGEVHAVIGENGAGKSTLMKVLTGVYQKDKGEYLFEGLPVENPTVQQTIKMGLSCIYQELTIVPLLDVARNLYLGSLPLKKSGIIDYKKLYSDSREVLKMLGMDLSPATIMRYLSVASHQMIEIGRAVIRNAKVIIMDEPTSSLTTRETQILFRVIRSLTEKGIAVFYISHKLEELTEIADRISVFRDGQKVATFNNDEEVTHEKIIGLMIGRKIENYFNKQQCRIGDVVLEAKHLTRAGVFEDVSFSVRSGEVFGFFGLIGAGRSEVMRAIFGIDKLDSGEIYINGIKQRCTSPKKAIRAGIGLVPEDRRGQGLILKLDVKTNETLIKITEINTLGIIDRAGEEEAALKLKEQLDIKTPSLRKIVGELSGGNQQKVVMSKWLMMNPRVLVFDEPTRGIDVGAKSEIYRLINGLAARGVAVVVISSELPEILGISDRIITMHEGRVTGEMESSKTDSREVMRGALGGRREADAV